MSTISAFACNCGCGFDQPDPRLVAIVVEVQDQFGDALVTSGCRCPAHNTEVGGSHNSYHLNGMAADVQVSGFAPELVYSWLKAKFGETVGLCERRSFVHVDTRGIRVPYHSELPKEDLS